MSESEAEYLEVTIRRETTVYIKITGDHELDPFELARDHAEGSSMYETRKDESGETTTAGETGWDEEFDVEHIDEADFDHYTRYAKSALASANLRREERRKQAGSPS